MDAFISFFGSEFGRTMVIVVSVVLAAFSIHSAKLIARRKQTADLLLTSRGDEELQRAAAVIASFHDAPDKNLRALADPAQRNTEEAKSVRYLLNHFETVSIGLQAGIYDEAMLKKCWYGILISTFERTRPLISALRTSSNRPTVMQEFEWLAERWKAKPLKPRKNHIPG